MWPFTRAKDGDGGASAPAAAPPVPEPAVDLLDHAAVKRALDDAFAEAFLEAGHVEDMRLFNWKFGLGTVACLVALLAQFYPGKPPATAPLLAGCVAAYVALSLAAGGFATWVERDAFLVTRAQEPPAPGALRISSVMPRFSPDYELVLEATDGRLLDGATLFGGGASAASAATGASPRRRPAAAGSAAAATSSPHRARATLALSATAFFRADGTLDKEAVKDAAARAGAELESRRKTS